MYDYSELFSNPWFLLGLALEILFKGIALWKTGRNNQLGWYIILFLINTAGILPLIYILFFQKKKKAVYY
jgi:methionyl-tRNA synthetase